MDTPEGTWVLPAGLACAIAPLLYVPYAPGPFSVYDGAAPIAAEHLSGAS